MTESVSGETSEKKPIEVKERTWSTLLEDCRQEVVKLLDHKSKFKLAICSKHDYKTVDNAPVKVYSVSFCDHVIDDAWRTDLTVGVHFDEKSDDFIQLNFSQLGEDTHIKWKTNFSKHPTEEKSVVWKSCHFFEEAVKFMENWMEKGKYEIKDVLISTVRYPFEMSRIKKFPRSKIARITSNGEETFEWWLKKFPKNLDMAYLGSVSLPKDNFSKALIAPKSGSHPPQLSDEQFMSVDAKTIAIVESSVTDEGINLFLTRWATKEGIEDFQHAYVSSKNTLDMNNVLSGLRFREWDKNFQIENKAFCDSYMDEFGGTSKTEHIFQVSSFIDPYESVTVRIERQSVCILPTGKKAEGKWRQYTIYQIPISVIIDLDLDSDSESLSFWTGA